MRDYIIKALLDSKNIILVWKTNSWKTYFIENSLISLLKEKNINFSYFKDCNDLNINNSEIYLIDEVELLFDREYLELNHPEENPYYSENYLEKVKKWHDKLSKIEKPILCVVTRNDKKEVNNLIKNYNFLEWNWKKTEVIEFNWF